MNIRLINTLENIRINFNHQAEKDLYTGDTYSGGVADGLAVALSKLRRGNIKYYFNDEATTSVSRYIPSDDRMSFSSKYSIAHLLGITRDHEKVFREHEIKLTKMGYICFAPAIYDYEVYKEYEDMINKMCFEKLMVSDICVLVTPEHVGKRTTETIKTAQKLEIPVYTLNGDTLVPYVIKE